MSFKQAEKVAKIIQVAAVLPLIGFLVYRYTQPVVGWVCFALVFVMCALSFPVSWKYMRCPYCDHVIPAFRTFKNQCNACNNDLTFDVNGYLVKIEQTKYHNPNKSGGKKKKK